MKVLIGGPVRQDPDIFKEHLKSIRSLIVPAGCQVDIHFIFNDCDLSGMLEDSETFEMINTNDEYICDEQTHRWTAENLNKMTPLRNNMLRRALEGGYDYYFLVDSDLVLKPNTLLLLMAQEKDLIAELFWTEGEPGSNFFWPNAWEYNQCETEKETVRNWIKPGIYQCGGTGACFLIHRRVIEAGVNYDPISNIRGLKGEDRWFCIRAICHGFDIWLDNHCMPIHLYRRSIYEEYMRGEEHGLT